MLVTLFGIEILVRLVQSKKVSSPMLVTLAPPKVPGITSAPSNPAGAVKPVIVALPSAIVYVSPVLASDSAKTVSLLKITIPMTIERLKIMDRTRFARVVFITSSVLLTIHYAYLPYTIFLRDCFFYGVAFTADVMTL
jgi:hypothetical protein